MLPEGSSEFWCFFFGGGGSLCLAVAASSFFQIFSVFEFFFDQIFFDFYFFGSFLYFKELIVAKNYIRSWGQTFGTLDFDLWVRSVPASGSKVPGVEKNKNS